MSFEVIGDSQDREQWLALRRTGIGASDMPGVLGVSPWSSPLSVYADKIEPHEDAEESCAQRWGRILEPHIIEEFGREVGRTVARQSKLLRSTRWPWMLATLDAEQTGEGKPGTGALEVKATGFRVGDWTEGIPTPVTVQVQQQLAVTGYAWGSVAVLLNGMQLLYADVERDDALIARIAEAGEEFWKRVERHEPPHPDGSASAREALRVLYPRDSGASIPLAAEFLDLDSEREAIKAVMAKEEKRLDEIEQRIKFAIGDATFGVLPDGVEFSNKHQKRAGYSVKATEFRVLRRSDKWKR